MFSMMSLLAPSRLSRRAPPDRAERRRRQGRGAPSPPATACAPAHVFDGAEHRATLRKPERATTRSVSLLLSGEEEEEVLLARSAGRACHGARAVQGRLRRRCLRNGTPRPDGRSVALSREIG